MSTGSTTTTGSADTDVRVWRFRLGRQILTPRVVALTGAGVLLLSCLTVLHDIANVTGDVTRLYLVVAASILGATVLARLVRTKVAIGIAGVALGVGLLWYLTTLSHEVLIAELVRSNIRLLTGQSLLQMKQAGLWAVVVAPAPVFVTWYLVLRRRYTAGAVVGGGTLLYFVLTGDAGTTTTLVGVVGATALVGFGDLDRREVSTGAAERVAIVLAAMVLAPLVITVVPGGTAGPVSPFGSDTPTMEASIVDTEEELEIVGDVELTPEVRFVVESSEPRYWRTGSYDRYTGDGWVQSGQPTPYEETSLSDPPGESSTLRQSIHVRTEMATLPAAWKPTSVSGLATDDVEVRGTGSLQYDGVVEPGQSYRVASEIQDPVASDLADEGTDYPDDIERVYTQLPDSTPDRVTERTAHITQNAENPLDKAILIERWLETNRGYSLDVEQPDGDVADAFLFEMDEGYCTYYATTMVAMLRTQDIPARMVVGYTPGEQVDDDQWVVRGMNSHAWVEVYFPETGWVQFDPTPAGPRDAAEQARLSDARSGGESGVDTNETEPELPDEDEDGDDEQQDDDTDDTDEQTDDREDDRTDGIDERTDDQQIDAEPDRGETDDVEVPGGLQGVNESAGLGSDGDSENDSDGTGTTVEGSGDSGAVGTAEIPHREQLVLGVVALVGILAGVRQSNLTGRLRRRVRIRFQRRKDPETDIERAHERLELLLASRYRPRETGETMRAYLDAVDAGARVRRVAEIREQARYGETVSPERADEAIGLVDSLVESRSNARARDRSNW